MYVRSAERLLYQLAADVTGVENYEIAGRDDMSVVSVAETVQEVLEAELRTTVDIELVENPRGDETLVEEFGVDISVADTVLGWEPQQSIRDSVRGLLRKA